MVRYFKPKKESLKGFMECDICERTDRKEIITLKPNRFSEKGTLKERNAKRVCFFCAQNLFLNRIYNFGNVWREIFFKALISANIKKAGYVALKQKYMVIHK